MKLFIVNKNSSDALSYASGQITVAAYSTMEISPALWFALYTDLQFIKDLRQKNITVNDGDRDIPSDDAEAFVERLNEFNYNNKDVDGALIIRQKAAKKGWSFWAIPIEITTSTLGGSLYCKDSLDNSIPGISCKIYDANNAEITTAGLLNVNLGTCVKTVIDFEPQFDYEIIGGQLRINSNPSTDIRLWIVGAPDIPAQYGGSKEFASGINLKFLAPDSSFDVDGRVTKTLFYDPVTHQGKMRIILKHPAGTQVNMQVVIHLYRM